MEVKNVEVGTRDIYPNIARSHSNRLMIMIINLFFSNKGNEIKVLVPHVKLNCKGY